jgi:hypothetical protein
VGNLWLDNPADNFYNAPGAHIGGTMKKALLFTALIIMLAGCATDTENIEPSSAPPPEMSYKDMTCDQLSQEHHRLAAALAAARDAQRNSSDFAIGGSFDGMPVTGLSKGGLEVDRLKDKLQELDEAAAQKNCSTP